jgi:hypothetical protein
MRVWSIPLLVLAMVVPSIAAGQSPTVVEVQDGQQYTWVPGLIAVLKADCWDRPTEPAQYLTGADGTPCYRSTEDFAGSDWLFNGSPVTTVTVSRGCQERFEVPGPGRMEWTVTYVTGPTYSSPNPLMCEWQGRFVDTKFERHSAEFLAPDEEGCDNEMRVTHAAGTAQASGQGVEVGQEIGYSTTLSTGEDGSLEVTLADNSVVRLGPNSRVRINCRDLPAGEFKLDLALELGRLWAAGQSLAGTNRQESIEVRTERAVAGPRGTIFEVDAGEHEDRFLVQEGEVEVRARRGNRSVVLGPCEAAVATSRSVVRPIPPYPSEFITVCTHAESE